MVLHEHAQCYSRPETPPSARVESGDETSSMLSGLWAYFRDKMPLCWKNVAREGCGYVFEVGIFSRDYSNNIICR